MAQRLKTDIALLTAALVAATLVLGANTSLADIIRVADQFGVVLMHH